MNTKVQNNMWEDLRRQPSSLRISPSDHDKWKTETYGVNENGLVNNAQGDTK